MSRQVFAVATRKISHFAHTHITARIISIYNIILQNAQEPLPENMLEPVRINNCRRARMIR